MRRAFLVGWVLVTAAGVARADGDDSRDTEARALYQAGATAYDGGRYAEALAHFRRSHELSGRPELLYNIATAAERAREDAIAVEAYERFLEESPDTPLRARVETRVEELTARIAQAEAARVVEEPAVSGPRSRAVPLAVLGSGAAVAIAGGVTLILGYGDKARVESPSEGSRDWHRDAADANRRGPALLAAGAVLLPVGVILTAAGTVWTLKVKRARDEPVTASLGVGLGSISIRGSF